MNLKPLLDLLSTTRMLPKVPAAAMPADTVAAPRILRRTMPLRGSPHRQLELDFRPASSRPRGLASPGSPSGDLRPDEHG